MRFTGQDKTLFDRNPSNDAFVVRTALVFLDGVRDGLERKRVVDEIRVERVTADGNDTTSQRHNNLSETIAISPPKKFKVLEELSEICEMARDHIIHKTKEKKRKENPYFKQQMAFLNTSSAGGRGGEDGIEDELDGEMIEGEIAQALVIAVGEYAVEHNEKMALQVRCVYWLCFIYLCCACVSR